jgi:spore germination protein
MEYPRQITVIQAAIILFSSIIGVGVLPLPLFAVRGADTGAPLVTLLGILLSTVGLIFLALLGMKYPGRSIVQYSEEIIGKWPARVMNLFLVLYAAQLTAIGSREFGEVVVTSVLQRTPIEVTVTVMLLLAALSSRCDLTTFAYIHHLYFPLIIFPVILIVALSLKNSHVLNLMPIWGNEPGGMLAAGVIVATLFQAYIIITIVIPGMRRPDRALSASLWGMLMAGGLYLMIVIATVSVFGPEEIKNLLWPTLELAKTTSLPANVLERLDGAFLAVWVTAVFTSLFAFYYLTIRFLSQMFGLRDHKLFSIIILPYLFIIAMVPSSIVDMYQKITQFGAWGMLITLVYPILLFFISLFRRKKGRKDNPSPL